MCEINKFFNEDEFYKEDGYPTEYFWYCDYLFKVGEDPEWGIDFDQFAFVKNCLYPYIRLTRKRGNSHYPCGGCSIIATDGSYAQITEEEKETLCPKIAWGFAAAFLASIKYDDKQKDFVPLKETKTLFKEYYERYWNLYQSEHNGLKYASVPIEQKELCFINAHIEIIKQLWERTSPLKSYTELYKYASEAEKGYEAYIIKRKQDIESKLMPRNNQFSTEICSSPSGPYIRVFFLDDSNAIRTKGVVEAVQSVRKVNTRESTSTSHPGNYLIVYLKPMVKGEYADKEIKEALNAFFSGLLQASTARKVKTDAYFDNIEQQVINDLKGARVSIHVAMAWFTNQRIADVLIEKFKEGLDVKVVSFDDHTNARFGVNLDGIPHKLVKVPSGGIMHDKFCVIDNQKVLTGSYNWSMKAENKNIENVPVIYDDARASDYSVEFRKLFDL